MRKQKSVWFLILGLLIALAGCGSDGNGRSPMDGMGGDTVDMTALNAAKAAAMAAYDAAMAALADVEANQSADQASYDKAAEQVEAAKAANDQAQAAETAADAQKYQKMAEDANTEAMKYAGMVTTAANDMMANAAKAAAMTAYEAAMAALEAVKDDQSADQASYDKAKKQVDAAKAANDQAQAAETAADAQKYQKMAEDANTEAMKYAGMVTAAANKAASAAAMAMAGKIATAIADPDGDMTLGENNAAAGQETNDDLDNPLRPGKATAATDDFVVSAGAIGTPPVIRIGDVATSDRLGMEDVGINNNVEFAEEPGTAVDGFTRNVHTRTRTIGGTKTTDKVTVLDNIDAPKNLPYREFYDDGAGSPIVRTDSASLNTGAFDRAAVISINAAGVLTLDTGADGGGDIDGNHALFSSTALPSGEDQTYTYVNDDPTTENANEERRGGRTLDGMFNGVPGKFACTGDTCSARTDSDGNLDQLVGVWTFTPAAGDHFVTGGSHDNDYLAFGYWLQSAGEGDATTYKVGTFANGSMPFGGDAVAAAVSALTGTATYTGSAIGMFVMKTDIDGDNKGPVATGSGEFTANTTLTAIFGGNTDTNNRDKFTISGMVNNFVLTNSDDTTIDNDWSLNLKSAPFADRVYDQGTGAVNAAPTAHRNTFSGATSGMEKGTDGRWAGMFYGPSPDTNLDDAGIQYGATNYPGGVAGEFIGHFEDGHAIGAFGATKQ